MRWTDPITDRTQADVLTRAQKAFFNIEDWLRVRSNTAIVRVVVGALLGQTTTGAELGVPAITDFPNVNTINAAIAEIDALRALAALPVTSGIVTLKHDYAAGSGAVAPDYLAVNAWERDLLLIRDLLVLAMERALYCGAFSCGQSMIEANRFRHWQGWVGSVSDTARTGRCGLSRPGQSRSRFNHWRSTGIQLKRAPRCGPADCGSGLARQNRYRRYA